jgi:phosphoribosylamine--glycine ligase
MGAYSPAPVVTAEIEAEVMREIIQPVIRAMAEEGNRYRGVLYAGLMITDEGPKVLEFNVRFGDPETQAVLPLLKTDLLLPLSACIDGTLGEISLEWKEGIALCVVLASRGYPGKYERGKEIRGLEELSSGERVHVFHAGTVRRDESLVTNGGRVLGVTGMGNSIREAIDTTYKAVGEIQFDGVYYRKDIGFRALNRKQ